MSEPMFITARSLALASGGLTLIAHWDSQQLKVQVAGEYREESAKCLVGHLVLRDMAHYSCVLIDVTDVRNLEPGLFGWLRQISVLGEECFIVRGHRMWNFPQDPLHFVERMPMPYAA